MNRIVLLGDSVFDNASYVLDGQSVKDMLSIKLKEDDIIDLLAVDGSVTEKVFEQVDHIHKDSTHIFVSTGGNDALAIRPQLQQANDEKSKDLIIPGISTSIKSFELNLHLLTRQLKQFDLPVVLCTIYNRVPGLSKHEISALRIFNDIIIDIAIHYGFSVLDLRTICVDEQDYSSISPIEPSEIGGLKIAASIGNIVYPEKINETSIVYAFKVDDRGQFNLTEEERKVEFSMIGKIMAEIYDG